MERYPSYIRVISYKINFYRFCNFGVYLDILAKYANIDYAAISEAVVRLGVSYFTDAPTKWNNFSTLLNQTPPDFFMAGMEFSYLVNIVTDINLI